ncbi:putative photosystem II PsbO, manganese-stabilising [Helianthus annuus]|uniref:Photosystem II PsbO, manganese-stabilising n=1 Tax=Helianthus annuus TaxID=4232 RepID=A0A9K3JS83_HELAN|nr:putative photosystem II PsbO, manganese-stabilising [Helianthus annuus]KAJ0621337.1 putative photosystem II PsbO, manganese-stabilising [Helianthus annuus]KAJ0955757.1 putative photosystem II PsbO, manganese-stabilising [Helianthus annuus]
MAASLQVAATFMTPTRRVRLKSSTSICKAFGVESTRSKVSCSLQADLKDFAQKCTDAAKIAGFALATSALVVSVCFLHSKCLMKCLREPCCVS